MTFSVSSKNRCFETTRLDMKLCREDDRESMLTLHSDNLKDNYLKSAFALAPESVTKELCDRFINNKISTNEYYADSDFKNLQCLFFKITRKDNGRLIGALEIYEKGSNTVEIGIFIEFESRGQGFASESVQEFLEFARKNTSIRTVLFTCRADNDASARVAQKCNFGDARLFVENGIRVKQLKYDII